MSIVARAVGKSGGNGYRHESNASERDVGEVSRLYQSASVEHRWNLLDKTVQLLGYYRKGEWRWGSPCL